MIPWEAAAMRIQFLQAVSTFALILFPAFSALAQQKGKPPPFPPINPAAARLSQTINGLDGAGFAIAYGDKMDLLFAACEGGTIQGWKKDVLMSIRAGSGSANRLRGHHGPVLRLAWNGGPILASLGSDHKVILWSVKEGTILKSFIATGNLRTLTMTPDGETLAGAGEDHAIYLWDLPGGKAREKLLDHKDWVSVLTYSLDGKWLASADFSGKVLLWDAVEGK
jgi:WD40 repeat protein